MVDAVFKHSRTGELLNDGLYDLLKEVEPPFVVSLQRWRGNYAVAVVRVGVVPEHPCKLGFVSFGLTGRDGTSKTGHWGRPDRLVLCPKPREQWRLVEPEDVDPLWWMEISEVLGVPWRKLRLNGRNGGRGISDGRGPDSDSVEVSTGAEGMVGSGVGRFGPFGDVVGGTCRADVEAPAGQPTEDAVQETEWEVTLHVASGQQWADVVWAVTESQAKIRASEKLYRAHRLHVPVYWVVAKPKQNR